MQNRLSRAITIILASAFFTATPTFALSDSCEYTGPPPPLAGIKLGDDIRILLMNVWGQNDDGEIKCQSRLKYLGEQIADSSPPFNIIGMTEVHPDYVGITCDGEELVEGLQNKGQYKGDKARWGHPETSWKEYDGGVSLFSTTEFVWSPYKDHVHRYTPKLNPRTAHGFIFARNRISPAVTIDVYVTHIHSNGGGIFSPECDQQCRYSELEQLAKGIHERSANSGNPVLVMGDFNIGGPNPGSNESECRGNRGYGDIMDLLINPRDLWLEAHPNRTGTTHPAKENSSDDNAPDLEKGQRIDFIFVMTDSYFTNSPYQLVIKNQEKVKLTNWTLPGYFRPTVEGGGGIDFKWIDGPFDISDHRGLDITLEFRERLDWGTILAIIN